MSVDFVKERKNSRHLATAVKQQRQINYLIQSSIQEDITAEYIKAWSQRKYITDDFFLNWVKTIFKTQNFLSFYKYLRHPLPSAKLVNDEIKPQLKRVFYAEDAYSKYVVRGNEVETPEELQANDFNEIIFDALLFNYNDIVVEDLKDVNDPFRHVVSIDKVVAIESHYGKIERLAYVATINDVYGTEIKGFLYIDDKAYIFYDREYNIKLQENHDLGVCPADYISNEAFSNDNDVVRKSIFSFVREELEEFVFLKTLQKMTEPNGAIPVVTMLKTDEKTKDGQIASGLPNEPMSSQSISGQKPENVGTDFPANNSPLQAGTIIKVPLVKKLDQSIDMDVVNNFLKFFHTPVECLEFLNKRIGEIKSSIVQTVLGDYSEQNQSAKNEMQISKSFVNKQDKLRSVSKALSKLRTNSDLKMLGLKYGINSISVDVFMGSDFFLETQTELLDLIAKSPNPLETKNLLVRMSQSKNRFNPGKAQREKLLYELMPYSSDTYFDKAVLQQIVTPENKALYTQFNYYISLFEAEYGDIQTFYSGLEASNSEKLILIKNLLNDLIIVPNEQPAQVII